MIRPLRSLALAAVLVCAAIGVVHADDARVRFTGEFVQGGLIVGQTEPGTRVRLNDRDVRVAADGRFVFGFGRDHEPFASLTLQFPDGSRDQRRLTVKARTYQVQRIDGLPKRMVTPPADVLERIRRENAKIADVRARDTADPMFADGFEWPAIGIISGVFGSQRILNGKPRRPHFGVDVAAPVGTPVHAPADGIVALAEPDLYFTGGTVMLDHGHGVTSVYSHLHSVTAKVGARVRRGETIGTIGATGRATGPHLDWRLNWFDQRLDPALLVGPMPAPKKTDGG